MATIEAEAVPPAPDERWSARVLRFAAKAPVQLLLLFVGLLWLVPTFGIFLTSMLAPADFSSEGWWQVFSEPSKLTWQNYEAIFDNDDVETYRVAQQVLRGEHGWLEAGMVRSGEER